MSLTSTMVTVVGRLVTLSSGHYGSLAPAGMRGKMIQNIKKVIPKNQPN